MDCLFCCFFFFCPPVVLQLSHCFPQAPLCFSTWSASVLAPFQRFLGGTAVDLWPCLGDIQGGLWPWR